MTSSVSSSFIGSEQVTTTWPDISPVRFSTSSKRGPVHRQQHRLGFLHRLSRCAGRRDPLAPHAATVLEFVARCARN